MSRLIDPPRAQWDKLLTPLTTGERAVAELFDAKLPNEWEMYIQPHLNGLRPDFVLLNPNSGIAVFEVKDWDLTALDYYVDYSGTGEPRLMARQKPGNAFSRQRDNPVNKIRLYKDELFGLYCPRLNEQSGLAVITAGIIFTRSPRAQVQKLFAPFRNRDDGIAKYPQYYPLSGSDDLKSGNIAHLFPEWWRTSSMYMSEDAAKDLRGWLKEPAFSREQREPLEMNNQQRRHATTRTSSGYRRLKGPAGSGKSLVLAARAAELASESKEILVCSFNITLLNYLRDLAARYKDKRQLLGGSITFLNFHSWCKRVCLATGHEQDYKELWRNSSDDDVLETHMAQLVHQIYDRQRQGNESLPLFYDAILTDEGQDFRLNWWQTLRKAVKDGGEMLLVADKTQNIYGTAGAWTEQAMVGAGFQGGPWAQLSTSYRLPPSIIPVIREFADEYLPDEESDIPPIEQAELDLYPTELRWVQVRPSDATEACVDEVRRQMVRLRVDTAIPDITFLSGGAVGRELVEDYRRKSVRVLNTFDHRGQEQRRQKLAFFQGDARVKATTLHSFKGWEARHLILYVENIDSARDRALLYTALTRLKRHVDGSVLTVVCSCPDLYDFGSQWPDFQDLTGNHTPSSRSDEDEEEFALPF